MHFEFTSLLTQHELVFIEGIFDKKKNKNGNLGVKISVVGC